MWSNIDKEALESRNPYSIPDTDHQGADKENPRLADGCKHGKRHQQADRRTDRYPTNLPMIDQPTGDQPRRPHSYRHINKEIARIGHFYFLSVQNDMSVYLHGRRFPAGRFQSIPDACRV